MNYVNEKYERKKRLSKKSKVFLTVKEIHEEKMKHFKNLQNTVLQLKKKELNKLKEKQINFHRIKKLNDEIKDIIEKKEENEYFLEVSSIINEYFSLDEKNIQDNSVDNHYYDDRKKNLTSLYYNALRLELPTIDINNRIPDTFNCIHCGAIDSVGETEEANICINCGTECRLIPYTTGPSFKEMEQYDFPTSPVDYKRINYFTECLNQVQAKEHADIPQEVFDSLILEIHKERIKDMSKLNKPSIKRLLKKCGHSKYYEHSQLLINRLNKIPSVKIPVSIEEKLKHMFNEIQEPWLIHKDNQRNNFFSYPYVIYKFFELLGLDEYKKYFECLKSRDKLYKQDVTWKKVMNELKFKDQSEDEYRIPWRFIPSV
jgi:predicted  nucleic acid-binding Zn-ribbon protein